MNEIRKDDEGNIIGCPKCGARHLRKSGFTYYSKSKKQVWFCPACSRKTLNPTILEESPFKVEDIATLPNEDAQKLISSNIATKIRIEE